MTKRKRKPKPAAKVWQASGVMLFRQREGVALRQAVRLAVADPLSYMRRDMRARLIDD